MTFAPASAIPDDAAMRARFAAARVRVAGAALRTPVMRSRQLDDATGAQVFVKCENLQHMGAFKFRGAWNFMAALEPAVRTRGIVCYSSGNHAQACALVARMNGAPCVVVMPSTAPAAKLAATRGYGAEILHYDLLNEPREELAIRTAAERGLTLVPPFDHPEIVCGQGTAAAELFEEAGALDVLLAPVGGGGLLSGTGLAAAVDGRGTRVIGVEPAGGDDAVRSFKSGRLETCEHADTICDGARTPSLSPLTLGLIQRHVSDVVPIPDADVIEAMRFLWERMKLVVEPTGALGIAALRAGHVRAPGQRVGVVISGGNVDLSEALKLFERR